MFNFKPADNEVKKVPFFDEVTSADGWEGHTTSKSVDKLISEIANNLTLLGCVFTGFQSGSFGERPGFQIHFAMKAPDGGLIPSRLNIACLPINPRRRLRYRRGVKHDPRLEGTQKMALYMTAKAIKGMYFLNVLSPAFIPFMSLMLGRGEATLGEAWLQSGSLAQLMPPANSHFDAGEIVDGEVQS